MWAKTSHLPAVAMLARKKYHPRPQNFLSLTMPLPIEIKAKDVVMKTQKTQAFGFPELPQENLAVQVKALRVMLHDLAQPLSVLAGTVDLLMFEIEPDSPLFPEVQRMSNQLQVVIDKIDAIRQVARHLNAHLEQ
jgi:signal transduction histidine kinase